jgi:hypothetical protein
VIVPLEPESTAPPTPTPDPEQPSQQKPPRRPAPRAENKADPTRAAKTEPPPPAVETVRPVTPPPTVTLQPELPANPAEMERRVREQLAQAKNDLNRVNYDKLNNDGRSQYDTAKRFMDQADQALKEKNLLFAVKVAEKAAGLAASLPVR